MGILDPPSTSTSTSTSPPPSTTTYTPPSRTRRSTCWAARDAFFACLDTHDIIDSISEEARATASCGALDEAFKRDCASSWVPYFKQRRVMEFKKKATLEQIAKEGGYAADGVGGGGATAR